MIGNVRIIKRNNKSLKTEIEQYLLPLSEKHTRILAEETSKEFSQQIKDSIVRPGSTGKLQSSFFFEKLIKGYGVGNISYLNQMVKQWYWLNYGIAQSGRTTPPRTTGYFQPGQANPDASEFRAGRFQHTTNANVYLLNPKKPIEAKNYIEKTFAKIFANASAILAGIK